MTPPRDFQRSAVYAAESTVPAGPTFASWSAVERFVESVVTSAFWQRIPGAPRVVLVRPGRGRRHAAASTDEHGVSELQLPKWARTPLVVVHELAHTITPSHEPAHGERFVENYLRLVTRFLDPARGDALRHAFAEHGVRSSLAAPEPTK